MAPFEEEKAGSPVDEDVIREHLNERLRAGRTPYEAAGEERFLNDVRINREVTSRELYEARMRVIDEWLSEHPLSEDDEFFARAYAHFLAERVIVDVHSKLDSAWKAWRNRLS